MAAATITPAALFAYATRYASRAEGAGRGTRYPTFRKAARRFRCSLDDVETACNDWTGDGYMKPAVGVGGNGGAYEFANRGEWLVEAYQ